MNWLHYLLEANIYLAVFYAGYCLFLNKETYYTLNRTYLLLSCLISFLLPLVQVGMLKPVDRDVTTTVYIVPNAIKPIENQADTISINLLNLFFYAYLLGVTVLAVTLLYKLFKLVQMTRSADKIADDRYKVVRLEGSNTAFSFFNYLFIGSKTTGSDIIIRHEMVHIRQKHTLDVLFLEIIKIINWFNPLVYLMQNSLKTVHEYIADEQTAAFENDTLAYSSFLVNNAYGLNGSPVANSFFNYNLLKKRIIMLNQKRSGNLARLKYLVAVPICGAALCASTLGFSKNYALVDLAPQHVAIDTVIKAKPLKSPPPPPAPPAKEPQVTVVKFPPPKVRVTKRPPPPPPVPPASAVKEIRIDKKSTAKPAVEEIRIDEKSAAAPEEIRIDEKPVTPATKSKALKAKDVKFPPPATKIQVDRRPPPPPPADPFDNLYKYIAKYVRYPKSAHDKHIGGKVIVAVTISNGKIDDVKLARPLYDDIDGEVIRVLKNYPESFAVKSGYYSLPVSFVLLDQSDNQVAKTPEDYTSNGKLPMVGKAPYPTLSMNEIVVTGYVNTK